MVSLWPQKQTMPSHMECNFTWNFVTILYLERASNLLSLWCIIDWNHKLRTVASNPSGFGRPRWEHITSVCVFKAGKDYQYCQAVWLFGILVTLFAKEYVSAISQRQINLQNSLITRTPNPSKMPQRFNVNLPHHLSRNKYITTHSNLNAHNMFSVAAFVMYQRVRALKIKFPISAWKSFLPIFGRAISPAFPQYFICRVDARPLPELRLHFRKKIRECSMQAVIVTRAEGG